MATKIPRKKNVATAANSAAEELDVLHPERIVTIAGAKVIVREYGGIEWLRLLPAARPMIDAVAEMLEAGSVPTYDRALEVLAANIDGLLPLIAQAADIDLVIIDSLTPDELELLLMTWWGVNGRFFIGRATNRVAVARAERRIVQSAGANSTQPSSPTGTTSTASAAIPSAS